MTCLGCGCLCDDVTVRLEEQRVVQFEPDCPVGLRWFEAAAGARGEPAASVDGASVDAGVAVERTVELLRGARRPVVYGLMLTTTEAVRDALALADRMRALVLLGRTAGDLDRVAAFQDLGRVSATLGEVKNRADLVVFWGCDSSRTHPRHGERYSIDASGRFLPRGRADRTVVVVSERPTSTAGEADLWIGVPAASDVEFMVALRWLLRDPLADTRRVAETCRVDQLAIGTFLETLSRARYGAIFFEARADGSRGTRAGWEAMTALVRDLNGSARFVLLGMGRGGNLAGAEAALTWQAGFPQGVDFRRGYPSPVDDRVTLDEVLAAREADALLIVADSLPKDLSDAALAHLRSIPTIVIAPGASEIAGFRPTVALASATCGLDVAGTVTRSDGVVLPLRPLRDPGYPSDRRWLSLIAEALGEDEGSGACPLTQPVRTDS